jgi:hypothetical protein
MHELYLMYIIQYNYIDIINSRLAYLLPTVKKMLNIRPNSVKKRQTFTFRIFSHKIVDMPTLSNFSYA